MELPGWNRETSPYHRGEQELQDRLGRKELQERMARRIQRPFMPEQHRTFFEQLPFMIAGSVDGDGWPWASMLFGPPGFVSTPDDTTLLIDARPIPGDPIAGNLVSGAPIGFVGIELPTRRRNRVNGVISPSGIEAQAGIGTQTIDERLRVEVVQSFGNCPQYIQTREEKIVRDLRRPGDVDVEAFTGFGERDVELIRSSDTLFVASYNIEDDIRDTGGVDVNHRGGRPGFVKIEGNTLTIPDYVGNFAFNTLGNFLLNPKAGLLFIDFATGDLLQLTGTVELLWDKTKEIEAFRGAERAWRFRLDHGIRLKKASPLVWTFGEASPNTHLTGDWEEAEKTLAAEAKRAAFRPFRVTRIEDESSSVRSFYLAPADDDGLADFKPGQYLTLRLTPPGLAPLIRTYTLSSAPSDPQYRISVKKEARGSASRYLHDGVRIGDVIEVKAPNGSFWMDTQQTRPAVLIAAGVGITPMLSMVRQIHSDAIQRRHLRPVTLFYAARSSTDRAFVDELSAFEQATTDAFRVVWLTSQPMQKEVADRAFHVSGRVSEAVLQRYLPLADYDFFVCGPTGFMQTVYDALRALGVNDDRIFAESFGPASLNRKPDTRRQEPEASFEPVDEAVVTFEGADVEQIWTKDNGTLLEFAQAHGLNPNYGCRSGACGACEVRLVSGKTGYKHRPTFEARRGHVLLCCSVPARSAEPLKLDV